MPAVPSPGRVAGAGRPREGRPVPRRDVLGPAGARVRRPGRADPAGRAWRRRPTAATGRAGCSPATRRATSCSRRCTRSGWRTSRRRGRPTTGWRSPTPTSRRPSDARRRRTSRCRPSATTARRSSPGSCALLARVRVLVALGAYGWEAALRAVADVAGEAAVPRPRPRFGHGAEARVGPYASSARTTRASRTRSPALPQQNTFTGKLTPADARGGPGSRCRARRRPSIFR